MRLVFSLLLVGLLAPPAVAQGDPYDPGPDWTLAGDARVSAVRTLSVDRRGTVWFDNGPHDIDSLNVVANAWQGYEVGGGAFGFKSAVFLPATLGAAPDTIVISAPARRSTDGGQTWGERTLIGGDVMLSPLPEQPAHGRIFAGVGGSGGLWTSDDRGVSWDSVAARAPRPDDRSAYGVSALAAFPAAGAPYGGGPGTGRLLLGGTNGVSYSDDGGDSWTASSLWTTLTQVEHLAVLARPEGGLRAVAFGYVNNIPCDGGIGCARVWTSNDGGVTWAETAQLTEPFGNGLGARLPSALVPVGAPPGDVTYGTGRAVAVLGRGRIYGTSDAGLTWAVLDGDLGQAPLEVPEHHSVGTAAMTWDGRLLLGITGQGGWPAWPLLSAERLDDVIPVAGEIVPAPVEGFGLTVEPNPSSGRATLRLTLGEAGPVVVEVYDALGRRVAELWAGPAPRAFTLTAELAAWAPGVYRIVARAPSGQISRALTVAR